MDEGKEFEHIQSHQAGEAESADDCLGVADVGRGTRGSQALARGLVAEAGEHAVLVQPNRMPRRHHEHRCARQRQRGWRWGGLA